MRKRIDDLSIQNVGRFNFVGIRVTQVVGIRRSDCSKAFLDEGSVTNNSKDGLPE